MHIKIAFIVSPISLASVSSVAGYKARTKNQNPQWSKESVDIFLMNSNTSVLDIAFILRHSSSPVFLNSNNLFLMTFLGESNLKHIKGGRNWNIDFERTLFDIQAEDSYFRFLFSEENQVWVVFNLRMAFLNQFRK